jgi:hypothetical protein
MHPIKLDRFSVASIALANQIVEASAEALARDMTGAPFERPKHQAKPIVNRTY